MEVPGAANQSIDKAAFLQWQAEPGWELPLQFAASIARNIGAGEGFGLAGA
jgi:hypothetical protein